VVNSLPLKQFGVNFGLLPNNRVRIQKLGTFRALGFGQIPQGAEIANGVLLKKPSGFYLHLTVYVPRDGSEKRTPAHPSGADKTGFGPVRLDLGVKYPLTLSNGLRFEYQIPPSRRLKRLQRRLSRQRERSKNGAHTRRLLREEGPVHRRRRAQG
jgi:putative transposase